MADNGQQGFAGMDEERRRDVTREGGYASQDSGHASHDKGNTQEFDNEEGVKAGRKGTKSRRMARTARATSEISATLSANEAGGSVENQQHNDDVSDTGGTQSSGGRTKKTRGGTHDQHVVAGKKGGSRIRELIELGYKYEEEHGIGPGRNDRAKTAARRRARKTSGQSGEGGEVEQSEPDIGTEEAE